MVVNCSPRYLGDKSRKNTWAQQFKTILDKILKARLKQMKTQ